MAIALVFSITWLPLNVFNLFLDLYNPFTRPEDEEKMAIIYATCHLIGMSSACANPFLYGWFNSTFRSEFVCIFRTHFRFCFGNNNAGRFCSCQPRAISVTEPSSNAINRSPIIPSVVIEARGMIGNSVQSATIDMIQANSSAVVSALTLGQPVIESSKIEEVVAVEDHCKVVSFTMTTAASMEEVVSKPVKILNDTHHQTTKMEVAKKCSQPSSSFLNPGCLETHL